MTRIAILASGAGTTAEAFIRACSAGQVSSAGISIEVVLVICNKPTAEIFQRVERLNQELGCTITTELVNAKNFPLMTNEAKIPGSQTLAEESAILRLLQEYDIDLVLLMGYLRRVGPRIVNEYGWRPEYSSPYQARMLNTHAGLLPETIGLWGVGIQQHVINNSLAEGGQTLHVVAEKYDEGPTLTEHRVAVEPGDTPEMFFSRVQIVEKASLPTDIQNFIAARQNFLKNHLKNTNT